MSWLRKAAVAHIQEARVECASFDSGDAYGMSKRVSTPAGRRALSPRRVSGDMADDARRAAERRRLAAAERRRLANWMASSPSSSRKVAPVAAAAAWDGPSHQLVNLEKALAIAINDAYHARTEDPIRFIAVRLLEKGYQNDGSAGLQDHDQNVDARVAVRINVSL